MQRKGRPTLDAMLPDPIAAQTVADLTQLLHAFFARLDERRYDELLALFLPEGRWLRQGRWLQGRAEIRAGLEARPATMRVRHVISNVLVLPGEGDDLRVQAYMTAYRQQAGEAAASLFRMNMVTNIVRPQGGGWRFVEQQLVPDLSFEAAA